MCDAEITGFVGSLLRAYSYHNKPNVRRHRQLAFVRQSVGLDIEKQHARLGALALNLAKKISGDGGFDAKPREGRFFAKLAVVVHSSASDVRRRAE
jgi:hypothetical protein